jgi:hypothetical protein
VGAGAGAAGVAICRPNSRRVFTGSAGVTERCGIVTVGVCGTGVVAGAASTNGRRVAGFKMRPVPAGFAERDIAGGGVDCGTLIREAVFAVLPIPGVDMLGAGVEVIGCDPVIGAGNVVTGAGTDVAGAGNPVTWRRSPRIAGLITRA